MAIEIGQGSGKKLSLERGLHQKGVNILHVINHGLADRNITFLHHISPFTCSEGETESDQTRLQKELRSLSPAACHRDRK